MQLAKVFGIYFGTELCNNCQRRFGCRRIGVCHEDANPCVLRFGEALQSPSDLFSNERSENRCPCTARMYDIIWCWPAQHGVGCFQ